MLNELKHSRPGLTDTYSTLVDGRPCKRTLSFVRLRLTAPVELSARYTTADRVLEIGSKRATVE